RAAAARDGFVHGGRALGRGPLHVGYDRDFIRGDAAFGPWPLNFRYDRDARWLDPGLRCWRQHRQGLVWLLVMGRPADRNLLGSRGCLRIKRLFFYGFRELL